MTPLMLAGLRLKIPTNSQTSIMKSVLPTQEIYISLFITAINLMMTFPENFLFKNLGRKSLLLLLAGLMAFTSLVLVLKRVRLLEHNIISWGDSDAVASSWEWLSDC
ncbi:uncharacterized protein PGTG_01131 [Puccinia graminis f. sp. tritici CRL 75-36-700-3]|uniref:Uncharacterized protein n=1 Tax=Puccinia graminis f. sp. tritici (strain CRL 75-36-700-3 / race SCCL) TaxID=418459 RepID=E3JUS5_PUCGT|nr:uncharacterized protein PGTG_01131 [Puccinia graminis f. sp. tritici CRL 75-36-700-3]EFP75800.1 hypothetical protein PGTG_01131 [Puccinia graminis f. sp. tritici CRL 75-36-700-3]